MTKAKQGDAVVWTDGNGNYAALVASINTDGSCNLAVFLDDQVDKHTMERGCVAFKRNVFFAETFWPATDGFRPMTWHWPSTPTPKNALESLV